MHYRLSAASGQVVDEGDGTAVVDGGAVTVSPQLGQPLRITPEQIVEVGEPVPFTVRIGLSDGSAVELSQLGAVRTQLLAQIGDIRVTDARAGLVTIGFGERQRFHGAVDGVDADISLYDDGLVALPVSGPPVQVPYSLIEDVTTDPSGYRISVSMGDAGTVVVQRLAQTTSSSSPSSVSGRRRRGGAPAPSCRHSSPGSGRSSSASSRGISATVWRSPGRPWMRSIPESGRPSSARRRCRSGPAAPH